MYQNQFHNVQIKKFLQRNMAAAAREIVSLGTEKS
jgi:hypothetical protein